MRTLLTLFLGAAGDRGGATTLLGELALDPEVTYRNEQLAKAFLATLVVEQQ